MNKCKSKHNSSLTIFQHFKLVCNNTTEQKGPTDLHENNNMQAVLKELGILYHKPQLGFPPFT